MLGYVNVRVRWAIIRVLISYLREAVRIEMWPKGRDFKFILSSDDSI
jgi:hypothetical protein